MSIGEMVQCQNMECGKWRLLYGEVVIFPWGSAYCKGDCAQRVRDFRADVVKGTRDIFIKPRRTLRADSVID